MLIEFAGHRLILPNLIIEFILQSSILQLNVLEAGEMGSFYRLNLLEIVGLELMLQLLELLHAVGLAIGELASVFLSFLLRLQQLIV